MRKLVSILLSVLLLTALVIPAAAEETDTMFTVTASTTEVEPGGTITLMVTATDAAAECYAFGVLLECAQDVFEVTNVTAEGMAGAFKYPFAWCPTAKRPEAGVGGWNIDQKQHGSSATLQKPTGDVGTITLKVKSGVAAGDYTIDGSVVLWTADGKKAGTVNSVTVTVKEASVIMGDINGNGKVDGFDLIRLQKYLAGESVTINEAASNVNGKGGIDGFDLIRLQRYLAGENVTLG